MICSNVCNIDRNIYSGSYNMFIRLGQSFIISIPAQKTTKQSHIGALAFVGGGKRTIWIKFYQYILNSIIHQVSAQTGNP